MVGMGVCEAFLAEGSSWLAWESVKLSSAEAIFMVGMGVCEAFLAEGIFMVGMGVCEAFFSRRDLHGWHGSL